MEAFFLSEAKEAVSAPAAAAGDGGEGGGGGGDADDAAAGDGAAEVLPTFLTFGTVLVVVFFRPRPLSENAKNTHTLLNNASKDLVGWDLENK